MNPQPDASFIEFLTDQLAALPDLVVKRMFGGAGFYQGGVFFAIVHQGRVYFKTDETTVSRYIQAGMEPFRPSAKQVLRHYYQVPVEVVEDADQLCNWAREAIAVASGQS